MIIASSSTFVGLRHDVDGKVWTKSVGTQDIYPARSRNRHMGAVSPAEGSASRPSLGIYQVISDSHNNLWMAEFQHGHLGKIDAKTCKVTWYDPPTPHARLRRMRSTIRTASS